MSIDAKTWVGYGSHLPVLMRLLEYTTGPVAELGCGMHSTPFLHWACKGKRPLVTFESDPVWVPFAREFEREGHAVVAVSDWDAVDLSRHWSVALVDHVPNERRWKELIALAHAEYVVAHDAENSAERKYHYSRAHRTFKYRTKVVTDGGCPYTSVLSNLHDVRGLVV